VTTFNLRRLRLRSGEQHSEAVEVEVDPLVIGGQDYVAAPAHVPAELTVTKASSGLVLQLSFRVRLEGPCFRCLADSTLGLPIHAREYQAENPGDDEDLRSPYVHDDLVELSAWARDALALELPDKILHDPGCAGLCPECGKDLNVEPHTHDEQRGDPRWAALEQLKNRASG
jgi:DUF177 domain-containing protein